MAKKTSIKFSDKNFLKEIIYNNKTSDDCHTMDDLYEHRNALYIALCRTLCEKLDNYVWRSKKHSDGSSAGKGWFVLGINESQGIQITYHLPITEWKSTSFAKTLPRAPKWDKHTPDDVLNRLDKL